MTTLTQAQVNKALAVVEDADLTHMTGHTKLVAEVAELQNGQALDFGQHRIREIIKRLRKAGWEVSDQNDSRMRVATMGDKVAIIFNRTGAFAAKHDMNRARAVYMLKGGATKRTVRKATTRRKQTAKAKEYTFSF